MPAASILSGGEGSDRRRHVRQLLGAAGGGDDDLAAAAVRRGAIGRGQRESGSCALVVAGGLLVS